MSEEEVDVAEIICLGTAKVELGQRLIKELDHLSKVDGVQKVQRKINQEVKFLNKKLRDGSIRMNHIHCSNLLHFDCLVRTLVKCHGIKHVDYALANQPDRHSPLRIDIVAENGGCWIKVIARNSKSIRDAVQGNTGFGTKSIIERAEEYVDAAQSNPHMFKPPVVLFVFSSEIDDDLIEELQETGVVVYHLEEFCKRTEVQGDALKDEISAQHLTETLNLDITTLLAYVSSLTNDKTNDGSYWKFQEELLTEQARWELRSPVKSLLDDIFGGRRLICCKTAIQSFKEIVDLLAGPNEKRRSEELLSRLEILDDIETLPADLEDLNVGGKIKPRSLKIFAFGMVHEAVTVTSNEGFIRSAKMKGIDCPAFVHEARALTEEKEKMATKVFP